jgi:hypothetical protein
VTPILIVLICGAFAHGTVSYLTRTPEDDHTPRRWKFWHTAVAGVVSGILMAIVAALIWVATGTFPPVWALLAASDVLTIAWKLNRHRTRTSEREALQDLFERPSFGEGSR